MQQWVSTFDKITKSPTLKKGFKLIIHLCPIGSGSLAAMAVFESGWKPSLTEEEGKKLVRDAIAAGIFNDLGSGSNVDLCVIRNSGPAQYLRTYEEANVKVTLIFTYDFLISSLYYLEDCSPVNYIYILLITYIIFILGQEARIVQISSRNHCRTKAAYYPTGS